MLKKAILATVILIVNSYARADDAFRHHQYKPGEIIKYDYEDTDTIFAAIQRDGTIQAGDSLLIKEIRIPVKIEFNAKGQALERTLTISPDTVYRQAAPATLTQTPFKPVLPKSFSYSYRDDTDALDHLQETFAQLKKEEVGKFLFFKTQDIHQMQESTDRIPEGLAPGETKFSARQKRAGLGGDFAFAQPGSQGLAVNVPAGKSWGRTGIMSAAGAPT